MKKNVIIFCVLAALAMLFASCKGGGGGDSKDSTTTTVDNAAGVWIEEVQLSIDLLGDGTERKFYMGKYLTDGKAFIIMTNDKKTAYCQKDSAPDNTYTINGNVITWKDGTTDTITGGDTITNGAVTIKKYPSIKLEAKTDAEMEIIAKTW